VTHHGNPAQLPHASDWHIYFSQSACVCARSHARSIVPHTHRKAAIFMLGVATIVIVLYALIRG
jgi:hypothetical protein